VSAAIDGLCAAVLRNNEVTLSAMEPPCTAGPPGTNRARHAWVARAGEHGPPVHTKGRVTRFNRCEKTVTAGTPGACSASRAPAAGGHTPNEWTVVVRYVSPGRSTVAGNDGWCGESGKCWVSRHSPSPCR